MTTKYQRQWTEFEALKSIYEKEFEELKFPWKVDHPPWFRINLLEGIVLEIKMTSVYPDGIPEIKVSCKEPNDSSLSKEKLSELSVKLRKQAEGLVGNEMCFDLIEMAREFSERHAKKGKTSFHSEMLLRQEERDKRAMDQQAIQLQKNEEMLQKQRKAEMEELEKKIRDELKEKINFKETEGNIIYKNRGVLEHFSFENNPISVDGIEIKSVQSCSNTFRSWTFGQIITVQDGDSKFDLKIVPLTHPFLQTFGGRRQLEILLKNLKSHQLGGGNENVLRCFGGAIDKENDQMLLLCERSNEKYVTLETVLEQSGVLSIDRVIEYLKQICTGLVRLHTVGLTHRSLNLNCVILDNKRNIKIVDYLVQRSLSDLVKEHGIDFENYKAESIDTSWEAPEIVAKPNFHGKKVDIWSLGRLTIQMLFGPNVLKCFPEGFNEFSKSSQSKSLPIFIKDFLIECLNADSGKRLTAEELLHCKLFKEPIDKVTVVSVQLEKVKRQQPENTTFKPTASSLNPVNPSTSRYLTDFEELEFLGRGGFGSVVKVRNKIDDRFYAVKKIALDPRDVEYNKKILREVTTLSRLHHERIIRYYQAWIEEENGDDSFSDEESDSFYSSREDLLKSNVSRKTPLDLSLGPKSFKPFCGLEEEEQDEDENGFDGNSESDKFDDFIQFAQSEEGSNLSDRSDNDLSDSDLIDNGLSDNGLSDNGLSVTSDSVSDISKAKVILLNNPRSQVLYIQMEYCPNQTLRDLIDERASDPSSHFLDPPEIWRLFRQIVEGLVHIHAQGMMHRDLKPSNIFLDSNGDVKIGDFGLAVTRIESAVNNNNNNSTMRPDSPVIIKIGDKSLTGESHTQNIGTPFYVSPEQMGTNASTARYNQKVDMYALGIILIELWVPFKTGMERIQSLQRCRLLDCILPPNLNENVVKIAKKLLCHDPKQRFTSLELLRSDLLPPILEEELIEDAMRGVAQPGAPHYTRLISTIFRRLNEMDSSQLRPKDFAFDVHSGNATELQSCEEVARLKREIERIFIRFGAVEVNPPLLYLPLKASGPQMYSVLDDSGQRLELPGNLTRPFARWVAQSSLQLKSGSGFKRFTFDRVFRKISQVSGGQPYQPTEAAFDLVHLDDERGLLELCEVVRVLFEALMSLSVGKPEQLIFKFNHLKLRESLVGAQKFTEEVDNFAGQSVQRLSPGSLDEKLVRLLTPLKSDEPAEVLLQRLTGPFGDSKSNLLKEISNTLTFLQKISIPLKVKVIFDPLFKGPRADLYLNDICFVVMREVQGERPRRYGGVSNYEMIACGGRYNQLVEEYKFPTARLEGKGPFAVGCNIFMDKLRPYVNKHQPQQQQQQQRKTNLILNLLGDEPNSDELWLIGEIWRLGRSNLTVNPKNSTKTANTKMTVVLQMKATGRVVRLKNKSSVEEVALETISGKLEEILGSDHSGDPIQSDLETGVNNLSGSIDAENDTNFEGIHYVLQAKSEKNPFLREKAVKAVKSLNPGRSEIIIHELPRDTLRRFLYDPGNNTRITTGGKPSSINEEYREQLTKLSQLLQTKLAGKPVILFNHKDHQIDMYYK